MVTFVKLPESAFVALMMSLKVVEVEANAKILPCGASSNVPPRKPTVPALTVANVPAAVLCVTCNTSVPPVWL